MEPFRIAILWRGDREARQAPTPRNNGYELAALGIRAEPAKTAVLAVCAPQSALFNTS
jgi:hypothetical protein